MTTTGSEQAIALARRALARMELGRLDYLRALQHIAQQGMPHRDIARALHLNKSEIALALMDADITAVTPVREGFSGASPYEIAQRYAAGDIDRDTMIRELSAWPYLKRPDHSELLAMDWKPILPDDPPGTVEEVGEAFDRGLIDGDAYEKILNDSHDVPGP